MFGSELRLTKPGLFVTGTDTGVGKTAVTCAIAAALRAGGSGRGGRTDRGLRVGVCKPMATGCRRDREGLVSEDTEALAHFADCRQPLELITPVRYAQPLAPAVAAEQTGRAVDFGTIAHALRVIEDWADVMLIEGIGGAMAPIDGEKPKRTVLDLASALGYPVLVVARAGLGTLSHTALTVRALKSSGCRVAGLAVNSYDADVSDPNAAAGRDPSVASNRLWLQRMTGLPILATVPTCPAAAVQPHKARLPREILEAVALTYWPDVLGVPARASS